MLGGRQPTPARERTTCIGPPPSASSISGGRRRRPGRTRRLEPVLREGAEEPAEEGPAHPDVGVAPVIGVVGCRPSTPWRLPHAADHAHPAVGDEELAVRAVVHPLDRVGLRGPEAGEKLLQRASCRGPLGLDSFTVPTGVEQDVAAHAKGPGAATAAAISRRRRRRGASNVGQEAERPLRVLDRVEEGGEDRVAVGMSSSTSSPQERGARQGLGRARKLASRGWTSPRRSYPSPLSRRWRSESAAYQAAPRRPGRPASLARGDQPAGGRNGVHAARDTPRRDPPENRGTASYLAATRRPRCRRCRSPRWTSRSPMWA